MAVFPLTKKRLARYLQAVIGRRLTEDERVQVRVWCPILNAAYRAGEQKDRAGLWKCIERMQETEAGEMHCAMLTSVVDAWVQGYQAAALAWAAGGRETE